MAGVLAVTRSLGDASMKEFVVGSPYTTETALDDRDEFLIVACDGVSLPLPCLHHNC
jgi:protein phosphatase PTC1